MNIARPATFLPHFSAFSPLFALPLLVAPLQAAPALKAAPRPISTLSFDVTARFAATGAYAGPQQTVQAKVLLRGDAARVETVVNREPSVVLFAPPYIYRLLPQSKAGVRWKIDARKATSNFAALDPQQLLRDPTKIKGALLQGGAKVVGQGAIGGVPVEIYQAKNFGGRGQNAKVWLRRSDSLPLRLEAGGGQLKIVASWRNYARPKLPATLFGAPQGYRIRNLTGSPPFSSL